jgi:NAD(P)-dependent dehydrogenase (short-subunit alcohol dehydrogenase family)
MSIYRADPAHGVAWITGGGTGIGRALALDLARAGFVVAVTGRMEDPVEDLVEAASGLPGRVMSFSCDVTDEGGMAATVTRIEAEAGPIVLAIFNAGVYLPAHGENLQISSFRQAYEVNLFGVLNGLVPTVERMHQRNRGHIVIVGSIMSYFGWPMAAAYGSTKAALNNLAEALRFDFPKMNIRIQVVNPGFVDTSLIPADEFKLPALLPVEKASKRMLEAIRSGGFEVTFPRRTTWAFKLLRLMPISVVHATMTWLSKWKRRPLGVTHSRLGRPQDDLGPS